MSYFANVATLDEGKARYRALTKQHHPDAGGDTVIMQEINAEWEVIAPHLASHTPALRQTPRHDPALVRAQWDRMDAAMLASARLICPEARVYIRGNRYDQHICIGVPADHPAREALRTAGYKRHSAWKCWRRRTRDFPEYDEFIAWLRGERATAPFADTAELEVAS